ncbi:MAG: phosphatase [Acidimicrobiia bacterium]
MTRRPASRRPPKLEDLPEPAEPRMRTQGLREQVTRTRITGSHARLGRTELLSMMRRLRDGERSTLWGLDPFPGLELDEIFDVAREQWGWTHGEAKVAIGPDRTREALASALALMDAVARDGGRIAFATGRPASMLPLLQKLAARARAGGADVVVEQQSGEFRSDGRSGRRLWWVGDVAVITDGRHLLAQTAVDAVDEWLFWMPRPRLVVADSGFAAGAVRDGIETVALADYDALALGVARSRGRPVAVVPMDLSRAPYGYGIVLAWADQLAAALGNEAVGAGSERAAPAAEARAEAAERVGLDSTRDAETA